MYNYVLKSLVSGFRQQDKESFEIIYDEFKPIINYYSRRQKDEDIIGELTLFLLELLYHIDLDRFDSDKSEDLRKYISVSLKNKYISLCRKKAKENVVLKDFCEEELIYESSAQMYIDINEAFEKLTERQKSIIVCKYIYCLSDSQISDMFKISRQAVNRLKNRALTVLKEYYIR